MSGSCRLCARSLLLVVSLLCGWPALVTAQGDDCISATPVGLGANPFDTTGFTDSSVPPPACGPDFGGVHSDGWFTFTAPTTGSIDIDTCDPAGFDTDLVIYEGTCGALTQLGCDGDGGTAPGCQSFASALTNIPVVAGTVYTIRVGGFGPTSQGPGTLNLTSGCEPVGISELEADVLGGPAPLRVSFLSSLAGSEPLQYQWQTSDGQISTNPGFATFTFSGPGTYDVTLIATNPCGSVSQTFGPIQVDPAGQFIRTDCNGDGITNIADPVFLLSALFPPPGGPPPIPCRDACDCNDDGTLNIADAICALQLLFPGDGGPPTPLPPYPGCGLDPTPDPLTCDSSPCSPAGSLLQDFEILLLSGATQNDEQIENPEGSAFAYAGVPVEFQVHALVDPPSSVRVRGLTGGAGLPATVLDVELSFVGGFSQIVTLPPAQRGETTYLSLATPTEPDVALMVLRTEAGPIGTAQALDCLTWQQQALGLTVLQSALDFQLDPGPDGFILDPAPPILNLEPDDPFQGEVGTSDSYILRLYDLAGEPATYQPVTIFVDNPSVIGLRRSGFDTEPPLPELSLLTNDDGFVILRVVYLGSGTSGLGITSEVAPGPVLPAPDLVGNPAVFNGVIEQDPAVPTIQSVKVARCIENAGQPNEKSVPINSGLGEDAPLLTFGNKYEIEAKLSGPLPAGTELRWCILKFGNTVQVVEQDGKICITTPDPNPGTSGDKAHVGIDVKITQANAAVTDSEFLDFDIVEKKTIHICPIHWGAGVPNMARWNQIAEKVNEIYSGTGVCFTIDAIQVGGTSTKELCACITAVADCPGRTSKRTLTGTLKTCVEGDDTLEGTANKVTIHVGVNFKLKSGTDAADCRGGYNGSATGAKDVLEGAGVKADYDIDDDWLNAIVLRPNLLGPAQGEQTTGHELAHILGLPHVGNSETDNLLHPSGESTAGSKRKLKPGQPAMIYKKACELLE